MSAHGLVARGLPPWPAWLLYVKIAILVLSLIVLALAAWAISIAGGWVYGTTGAAGLLVFAVSFGLGFLYLSVVSYGS